MQFLFKIFRSLSFLTFQLANSYSTTSIGYDIMATKEKKEIRNTSRIIIQSKAKMDIFFFQQKKIRNISKRGNSNRINRTSETTLRDKERGRERKKSEGG